MTQRKAKQNLVNQTNLNPPAGSTSGNWLGTTISMPQLSPMGGLIAKGQPMKPKSVNAGLTGKKPIKRKQ